MKAKICNEKCDRCGTCIAVCPANALLLLSASLVIDPDRCTGCERCVAVCPTGAITGPRSEPHNLDPEKCIKCRSCYEVCRFDAIAGDAIVIESRGQRDA